MLRSRARGTGLVCLTLILPCLILCACAATTSVQVVKMAPDGTTVLNETTVTFPWMEANLPVMGDGTTHYYLQGPVFVDDPDPAKEMALRWNPAEDTNVQEKDMGAVKGTDLADLCDLVGGMGPGEMVRVRAEDGFTKDFGYRNVYSPPARQGPIVLTWWKADEGYVPEYREGMRIIFYADTSVNPWGIHAFGAWDWHESADERFWYYYRSGEEQYPTTTGLSAMYVSQITILPDPGADPSPSPTKPSLEPLLGAGAILAAAALAARGLQRGMP
ncbi:MAG: argininosuccinate synthase [Methanomicrobiales archaeon]|nr:argininosuccinate synthase [Methanomicrobiales archaeon]